MEVSAAHGQIWTFRDGRVTRMQWFNTHREALEAAGPRGSLTHMEMRAGERELYEGRPSWRALMSFYAIGIGVAGLVLVVVGLLADCGGRRSGSPRSSPG